ncbi:MAG: dolichyl-phosphate beta-glucosyltransferase [Verrucomicrobiota bacterium]
MQINVTIPVFNEASRLPASVPKLHQFLTEHCRFKFEIVIADNASADRTLEIARSLSQTYEGMRVVHLDQKGRGRAIKKVWTESQADLLSYIDVDLSTDLAALPPLIEALASNGFDLAVGSRLLKTSLTTRGLKRECISRCYNNLLINALFHTRFSDAQCGFKAITRKAATELLPLVEDDAWFMDTELLILAEKLGYRIFDLPVRWVDDPDSRVKIIQTAFHDVRGLIRLHRQLRKSPPFKMPANNQPSERRGSGNESMPN